MSWSTQRHRALSVDELAAMPAGRAAVSLLGTRPLCAPSAGEAHCRRALTSTEPLSVASARHGQ